MLRIVMNERGSWPVQGNFTRFIIHRREEISIAGVKREMNARCFSSLVVACIRVFNFKAIHDAIQSYIAQHRAHSKEATRDTYL